MNHCPQCLTANLAKVLFQKLVDYLENMALDGKRLRTLPNHKLLLTALRRGRHHDCYVWHQWRLYHPGKHFFQEERWDVFSVDGNEVRHDITMD